MGQLVAWSLLHGGPGIPMIAPLLFNWMSGVPVADGPSILSADAVSDFEIRNKIVEMAALNDAEFGAFKQENSDWLIDQGVDLRRGRMEIVNSLIKQHVFYR